MSKVQKRNFKVAAATGMTIFSLLTVFTSTIAWFSENLDVSATGMKIVADVDSGRLNKIEIFTLKRIDETGEEKVYVFDDTARATLEYSWTVHGSGTTAFPMGDYDPLSPDHPILVLFTLHNEYVSTKEGDIYIHGSTDVGGFLGETVDHAPKYNLTEDEPTLRNGTRDMDIDGIKHVGVFPLSSVVNFQCGNYSNDEYNGVLNEQGQVITPGVHDTTNKVINISTDKIELRESFVNFDKHSDKITFEPEPEIYESPAPTSSGSTKIQYIAMVVNYDEDAISAIYSTYLGDDNLETTFGGALAFYCDWALEVF